MPRGSCIATSRPLHVDDVLLAVAPELARRRQRAVGQEFAEAASRLAIRSMSLSTVAAVAPVAARCRRCPPSVRMPRSKHSIAQATVPPNETVSMPNLFSALVEQHDIGRSPMVEVRADRADASRTQARRTSAARPVASSLTRFLQRTEQA